MIPGPLFTLPMLLLLLAPFLAAGLSLLLLLRGLWWWLSYRHTPSVQRPRFWTWLVILLTALAVAGDIWGLVLTYQFQKTDERIRLQAHYRESRQRFVLPQDFQYGEMLFPKGTLINRYEAHDNGERQRPLGLRRLDAARFPEPVEIAGAWVNAIDTHGTLELARDQRIGPVYHFDRTVNEPYGAWVVDPKRPYLECRAGDIAHYHAPLIDYEIVSEFVVGEPDGALARFRPSQWGFTSCESGQAPIDVKPAYDQAAPPGAHTSVWGPLIPNEDD